MHLRAGRGARSPQSRRATSWCFSRGGFTWVAKCGTFSTEVMRGAGRAGSILAEAEVSHRLADPGGETRSFTPSLGRELGFPPVAFTESVISSASFYRAPTVC